MRIGLTYDLREDYLQRGFSEEETAEFDSPETITGLEEALGALGHDTVRIGSIHDLTKRLSRGERWDMVFNIAEGLRGFAREAQVPALLEAFDIPYVFSDPLVLSLALHKGMAKRVVRDNGLPTPDFALVETPDDIARVKLPYPLFCKPVAEGTSKGIGKSSKVENTAALKRTCLELLARHNQPVLVETYLPGREFTVGIIGTGADAHVLGVLEVSLNQGAESGIYSYHNKEHYESLVTYTLSRGKAETAAAKVALKAWRVLGCRDGGRVDIRLDDHGHAHFLEVNPLAGLHPIRSDLVILARQAGLNHTTLIGMILDAAIKRHGMQSLTTAGPAYLPREVGQTAQPRGQEALTP